MPKPVRPNPRLYLDFDTRLQENAEAATPRLKEARDTVAYLAEIYARSPVVDYPEEAHNALLIRARALQKRVVTLLVHWQLTADETYRTAALSHIREIASWEYWSWISMRKNDPRPEALFDLSYGENAATLAIFWDLLVSTLDRQERTVVIDTARRWVLTPFLENTGRSEPPHWFRNEHSNWNTVCSGGAGMLAVAMYEEFPSEAEEVLARAEHSIEPYFDTLGRTEGGWEEGIGYWNYGMRYAFMYLLSHERAYAEQHRFLGKQGVGRTLEFPLDFAPYGLGCSFGDVNRWRPLPFHYAAAARFDRPDLVRRLDSVSGSSSEAESESSWPNAAELLALYPGSSQRPAAPTSPVPYAKQYRGLDWCILADHPERPRLYFSVRGGTTELAHGHIDLLAFHCVGNGEKLLTHADIGPYNDMTFGPRRWEIFEMTPHATNTFLVNGVGISKPSEVSTDSITLDGAAGVRITATEAFGVMRDGAVARFAGRLILMVSSRTAVVVDTMELHQYGRLESRLHTPGEIVPVSHGTDVRGRSATLSLRFAADRPANVHYAIDPLSNPGPVYQMVRWCTDALVHSGTLVTAISRDERLSVSLEGNTETPPVAITMTDSEARYRVELGERLTLLGVERA